MANNIANLNSVLTGITSDFELTQDEGFKHISLEFSVVRKIFEDFSLIFESQKMSWEYFPLEFYFKNWDYYNYENIPLLFAITRGLVYLDIPFVFSVIKQPQSFMSYIFQKLYCVLTEITSSGLELSNWNVSPNKLWYLGITFIDLDTYDEYSEYDAVASLYASLADLNAGTNAAATGIIDSDTLTVILYDGTTALPFYYTDYPYHFTVSKYPMSEGKFKINPLTDMSEIRHPIYNNSNIVLSKGEAELNLHTYAILKKEFILGVHLPELEIGDVVKYASTRRNSENNSQILSQTISGDVGDDGETSLITSINVANYLEIFRQ